MKVAVSGGKRRFTGFGVFLLFVLAGAIFFYLNFKTVVVAGQSMEPTFQDKDRVLISRAYWLIGPIQRKDIVVLKDSGPTGYIIKRVSRLGGEKVGWLDIPESHPLDAGPYEVPKGMIYVLGDNRSHSFDSRRLGPRPLEDVLGKVVIWP